MMNKQTLSPKMRKTEKSAECLEPLLPTTASKVVLAGLRRKLDKIASRRWA